MPTYQYRCRKCGHSFELFHSIKDDGIKRCPKCRGRATRVPSGGAGLLFKGSGFYITDYRSSSYKEGAKQEKSGGASPASESGKPSGGGGESAKKPAPASGKDKKSSGSSGAGKSGAKD
jgi:putative FmdB family regulatory protein